MKRLEYLLYMILLSILLTGCQLFPFISDPILITATPDDLVTATPQTSPTSLPSTPTAATISTMTPTSTPEEPVMEPTPESSLRFSMQEGSPIHLSNFANPSAGCQWMGVAGQVFDEEGLEIEGLTIVSGTLVDNDGQEWSSVTGTAPAYGPGGYEIQLSDTPIESAHTFWIEVHAQDGTSLTDRFFFDTYEDCDQNLILINFVPSISSNAEKTGPTPQPTATLEAYP